MSGLRCSIAPRFACSRPRPPVENWTIIPGQCLRTPSWMRANFSGSEPEDSSGSRTWMCTSEAPASKASCVDSICSDGVTGTAGLSFFLGTAPVIATVMMTGWAIFDYCSAFPPRAMILRARARTDLPGPAADRRAHQVHLAFLGVPAEGGRDRSQPAAQRGAAGAKSRYRGGGRNGGGAQGAEKAGPGRRASRTLADGRHLLSRAGAGQAALRRGRAVGRARHDGVHHRGDEAHEFDSRRCARRGEGGSGGKCASRGIRRGPDADRARTMTKRFSFVDVTLRDAHQCLWSTRMTTAMMTPILEAIDRVGYDTINILGGAVFDVCVRYLQEDPYERVRLLCSRFSTPCDALTRGQSLYTFELFPDDIVALNAQVLARLGVKVLTVYDGLNDNRNLESSVSAGHEAGMKVNGWMTYTLSPVHTDEYYVERTKELVKLGVDLLCIKDPTGLLTPERGRTLFPAVVKAAGGLPVQLHSHCRPCLAPKRSE